MLLGSDSGRVDLLGVQNLTKIRQAGFVTAGKELEGSSEGRPGAGIEPAGLSRCR
jgi:hypothetical protein